MSNLTHADLQRVLEQAYTRRADLEHRIKKTQALAARNSLADFCELVIKDGQTVEPIILDELHKEWIAHINKYLPVPNAKIGIMSPFGVGKSTIVSIALPIFLLGHNQNLRIALVSNVLGNASGRVEACEGYIEHDPEYRLVFPHVLPDKNSHWSAEHMRVVRQSLSPNDSIEAVGVLTGIVGNRYDLILLDDICDIDDAMSEAIREQTKSVLYGAIMSRLDRGGRVVCVATSWHAMDAHAALVRNPDWKFLVQGVSEDMSCIEQPPAKYRGLPGVVIPDRPTIPLPNMLCKEAMISFRRAKPREYNRGMRQLPYSDEDVLFKPEGIKKAVRWDLHRDDYMGHCLAVYTGLDPGGKSQPKTVIFTFGIGPDKKKYVLDIRRGSWGPSRAMAEQVIEVWQKFKPGVITVENNALQEAVINVIREVAPIPLPIMGHNTGREKLDPVYGLPGLASEFESGDWVIPLKHVESHKDDPDGCGYCEYLIELEQYPQGTYSDCLMANFLANIGLTAAICSGATPLTATSEMIGREYAAMDRQLAKQNPQHRQWGPTVRIPTRR